MVSKNRALSKCGKARRGGTSPAGSSRAMSGRLTAAEVLSEAREKRLKSLMVRQKATVPPVMVLAR